jgi:hypothetical protein
MPYRTNSNFYDRHRFLKKAWSDFQTIYLILSVNRQLNLHAYYQPTKHLTESELDEHQRRFRKKKPLLAAKARLDFSKVYQAFRFAFEIARGDERRFRQAIFSVVPASVKGSVVLINRMGNRTIRAIALTRPEVDVPMMGRAIVSMTEQMTKPEDKANNNPSL